MILISLLSLCAISLAQDGSNELGARHELGINYKFKKTRWAWKTLVSLRLHKPINNFQQNLFRSGISYDLNPTSKTKIIPF